MESKLINNGRVIAVWRIQEYPSSISGEIYKVTGWGKNNEPISFDFFADALVKWDNCSHFRFFGDYYKSNTEYDNVNGTKNSYYHICGCEQYIEFSSILYFANITMSMINEQTNTFYDPELVMNKMMDFLEKFGYTIELVWD